MIDLIVHGERCYFVPHPGKARGGNKLDQFAELLSEGRTPSQAALEVYGTATCGNAMLQRIRKRLGAQAT